MKQQGTLTQDTDLAFVQSGFQKTELLPKHQLVPQVFAFEPKDIGERKKAFVRLCLTDIVMGGVQIIKPGGGENTLHSHEGQDGIYFCLQGLLHFYGENDVLLAELSKHQGIVIPRGYKYWLKAAGDEDAHMLQIAAFDRSRGNKHTSYGPPAKAENTFGILVLDGKMPDGELPKQ